jgi:glycosyltransferase involved in cell wall biosynthesis
MKILICNKFYYRRGGDCIYTLELEHLLRQQGHDVAVFAMQHPDNLPTPWSRYFPSEVDFGRKSDVLKALGRPLGCSSVGRRFAALIDDFQPDIVHLNNIHSQLSPVLAQVAHRKHIPVVWTTHDYKLLCPRYDCLRHGGEPCEACFSDKRQVLTHRCMKGSLPASALAYLEATRWNVRRLSSWVDAFIAPSDFMRRKLIAGGFPADRVHHIAHFMDTEKCKDAVRTPGDYYCYVGRLSHEKGIETLIRTAQGLPHRLKVIGDGPLRATLEQRYPSPNIEYLGFQPWEEIKRLLLGARFLVIPSEWYEVFGLVIIEALALGTPVLASNMGGIPELITPDNGLLYTAKDTQELGEKIQVMFQSQYDAHSIATRAQAEYAPQHYYEQLMKLYNTCCKKQ